MQIHEVANIFPLMEGEDYRAFRDDIRKNGQRLPIITHGGKIIDGRNRYRACKELGVAPKFQEWDGEGSLVAFVLSLNIPRRHLSPGQRAALAAEIEPMLAKEAEERRAAGLRKGAEPAPSESKAAIPAKSPVVARLPQREDAPAKSREQAAKATGASPRYVQDAKAVKEKAPEVFEKVKSGEVSIPEAKRAVAAKAAPEPKPEPATKPADPGVPHAAESAAVDAVLDQIDGLLRQLARLLDANKAEKKCRAPFAHFIAYLGSVQAIGGGVETIRQNLPGAADPTPPGYIPRRSVRQRADYAKGGR